MTENPQYSGGGSTFWTPYLDPCLSGAMVTHFKGKFITKIVGDLSNCYLVRLDTPYPYLGMDRSHFGLQIHNVLSTGPQDRVYASKGLQGLGGTMYGYFNILLLSVSTQDLKSISILLKPHLNNP